MSRHWFGGTVADFLVIAGAAVTVGEVEGFETVLAPSRTVRFWNAPSLGTQFTDLLDANATPITEVVTDATGGYPQLQGPDGVTAMWADGSADGSGPRRLVVATDLAATVLATEAAVAAVQASLAQRRPAILWDQGAGSYPARGSGLAGVRVQWVGPSAPPIGSTHAIEGDSWEKTLI
jgi:hypothetical protein